MTDQLRLEVIESASLRAAQRSAIIEMCNRAYEEDLAPLFDTFGAAMHVLGYYDQTLVSHAMWVTRWLQPGTLSLLRTAYIEMVATAQEYRGRGFAFAVMHRVAREIQDFDLGALCPSSVDYYARLGWERWRGPLFIRRDDGPVPTLEDEVVIILRLPRAHA